MPISHTRTHMHCNTRRETRTQTQQTYRIFHCAYVFEGWWAVAMLCAILVCVSVYPLARTEPIFKRLETPPSLSSFHEQLNRHNELRAYWKSPQSAMSRPTEFSTTKKHVKAALQRAQILLFSEWAQRERERESCSTAERENGWKTNREQGKQRNILHKENSQCDSTKSYVLHPIENSAPTDSISSATAVGTSWLPTFRL